MVAYLEKTDGNTEFHEIIDFLSRSSIHYALTSKIIDNVRHITAKVAGKPVTISEASIRSSLLFDDVDGIDSLNNQAIFDAIQLMGHLDAKKKFVMYPRFILVLLHQQLNNVPVPLDHFPINALTSKVFSFMVKKEKYFSGKVTSLFASMLVQPTKNEGEASERQSEPQPTPSLPHHLADQHEPMPDLSPRPTPTIPDSIPQGSGWNHRDQSSNDRSLSGSEDAQAKEIKHLKAQIKKLKKRSRPVINHHKAWLKATKLAKRRGVSKQGRKAVKSSKGKPTAYKDPAFDGDFKDLLDDAMDYQRAEDAKDKDSTDLHEGTDRENVSTDRENVSTDRVKEGTDRENVSTDRVKEGTDREKDSTDKLDEGTAEPRDGNSDESAAPTTIFKDDETIAQFLVAMSQDRAKQKSVEIKDSEDIARPKQKGVEIKESEDSARPKPTSTRSLLTLKPLPKIDPKDKGKKVLEEEAESDDESEGFDEVSRKFGQLTKDEELAKKKVPCSTKSCSNQKQTTYKNSAEKSNDDLSEASKDDNERAKDPKEKRVVKEAPKEEDIAMVPTEHEVTEQGIKKRKSNHVKMIARKRPRPQPDGDSDDEHRKCLKIVQFDSTIDSEIMETKSLISKLHKVSSPDGDYLVIYRVNGYFRAFNYLLEVLHILNRQDLFHLYDLVIQQYSEITPEGIKLILWGDLKIMMESSTEENDQELKNETVIHMLVERRYPISKEMLQRMLDLGLEVEKESATALHLVKFIKQQLNEE
ncbi:hypothetical protein Tco_1312902 [Tanacetum coccineum]